MPRSSAFPTSPNSSSCDTFCATESMCSSKSRYGWRVDSDIAELEELARRQNAVIYTAYNHRFEPHFVRMRDLIASGQLGKIYSCRMFYGNGTARLVREFGVARHGRRRAAGSRIAPARHMPVLVWRRRPIHFVLSPPTVSKTKRPIT